LATIADKN
jgi:hypothetical protein